MDKLNPNKIIKITIPLPPVTKKNSAEIWRNSKTGRPFTVPSSQYREYEKAAVLFLQPLQIDYPVNVKAVYYMPTRRRVDLINLHSALHDVLVKGGVVIDDNCTVDCRQIPDFIRICPPVQRTLPYGGL